MIGVASIRGLVGVAMNPVKMVLKHFPEDVAGPA